MLCLSLSLQVAVLSDAGPEAPLGADDRQRGRSRDVEQGAAPPLLPEYEAQPGGNEGGGSGDIVKGPFGLGEVRHEGGGDEAEERKLEEMGVVEKAEMMGHGQIERG